MLALPSSSRPPSRRSRAKPSPPTPVEGVTVTAPRGDAPDVVASWPAQGAAVTGGTMVLKVTFSQPMSAHRLALLARGRRRLPPLPRSPAPAGRRQDLRADVRHHRRRRWGVRSAGAGRGRARLRRGGRQAARALRPEVHHHRRPARRLAGRRHDRRLARATTRAPSWTTRRRPRPARPRRRPRRTAEFPRGALAPPGRARHIALDARPTGARRPRPCSSRPKTPPTR